MHIPFVKYQGTGNDFVIIDQRQFTFIKPGDQALIARLCDRRFGIGADGLMLVESSNEAPFRMVYFNADGKESTMCGNGGRCIAHFAHSLGIISESGSFLAIDGWHEVKIQQDWVNLRMGDVAEIKTSGQDFTVNTGSPHYIQLVDKLPDNVDDEGRKVRYSPEFREAGINVNFVQFNKIKNEATVVTYERGVEAETLSCGTGVTAAALICGKILGASSPVNIITKGGQLAVSFVRTGERFTDVWLSGPAQFVFRGEWPVS